MLPFLPGSKLFYIFPASVQEIQEHGDHTEGKTDWKTCHNVLTIDKMGNQVGTGDADRPEHQNIDYGRVTHLSDTVDKADNAIKHGIGPGEGQNNPDITHSQSQYCGILGKES